MPKEFRHKGLGFLYPDNWVLDEEEWLAGHRSVTVHAPGGGFWSVAFYPPETDPQELAQTAVRTMQSEYKGVEAETVQETVAERELIGYDFAFFYLDFIVAAKIRCIRTDRFTLAVFCQAEDREFETIGPVFQAMTTSLVQSIRPLRYDWPD